MRLLAGNIPVYKSNYGAPTIACQYKNARIVSFFAFFWRCYEREGLRDGARRGRFPNGGSSAQEKEFSSSAIRGQIDSRGRVKQACLPG